MGRSKFNAGDLQIGISRKSVLSVSFPKSHQIQMHILLWTALAACVFAQQNPYISQLNAIRAANPALPKECFYGLDTIQTGNTTVLATFCSARLLSNFDPLNSFNCYASYVGPFPSASSVANPKRDAGSSSASLDLFRTVSKMVVGICNNAFQEADSSGPGPNGQPIVITVPGQPQSPPTGSNSPYTGDSKAITGFINDRKLDLSLSSLIKSLVQVSVSLKSGESQKVPGIEVAGGSSHGVVIQVLADGLQVVYIGSNGIDSNSNNRTSGAAIIALTIGASVTSIWLDVALSPSSESQEIGNQLSITIYDSNYQYIRNYLFELRALRRRARDANLQIIIGAAPVGFFASSVATSISSLASASATTFASKNILPSSAISLSALASAASGQATTSSVTTASSSSGTLTPSITPTGSTTGFTTATTTASTTATTPAKASTSSGDQTKAPKTTTADNINIKVAAGSVIKTSVLFIVAASVFLI
ncbi:hypothetical protein HDU79_008044 [Rhizoclosmatium sp. JEL0117]|nr:hypothetical protein HDU79_008044 [Rhizoclosmatium sp. JEL0117]